ncbi:nickel/cobalt transporter [Campylobacter lari]|nr:DUF1007 family protein [Campylobacter lari]EAK9938051.1 DUF1007 family protein [Campylobacter lari]
MKFFFILFFITLKNLYACALCAAYTPSANISVDFNTSSDKIEQINIRWDFSEEFYKVLLENYDFNYNNQFDNDELQIIKYTLLDYIEPKNFLTQFEFYDLDENISIKGFQNPKLYLNPPGLSFSYEVALNLPIKDKASFSIKIYDEGGFFDFKFKNANSLTLNSKYYITPNPNLNVIFFQMYKGKLPQNMFIQKAPEPIKTQTLLEKLNDFNNNLFSYIKNILQKDFDLKSFVILLAISFAYGVFHASAPGHAKTLTSSYFLTHKSSWLKILYFVSKIGIMHILNAFLLVSIGVVLLENLLKDVNNEAGFILTKLTSTAIIIIALFMISKKILQKKSHCCCANHKVNEWGIILSVALVPCPGVVLLFVFAYEFSFWYALSSAIFMTLGMCLVLFAFALGANKIYQHTSHQKIRNIIEYLGMIIMLLFGLFLFINTKASAF